MEHVNLGSISVHRVPEIAGPLAHAQTFFPEMTDDMLAAARRDLPPGNLTAEGEIILSFHSYLIRTGNYTILVDSCCGNGKDRPHRPAFSNLDTPYLETLAAAGSKPEDIDFVLCTHLHWDHVGWNTRLVDGEWVPTFPNARYVMSRREYEYWDAYYTKDPGNVHRGAFEDSVVPLMRAEKAVLVDDSFEFDTGAWLEPCSGHTPGQVVMNVSSGGKSGVVTGDVIHHRIQLAEPQLTTLADTDREAARRSRLLLLEKHADTGNLIFPAHFPAPSFGAIASKTGGHGFTFEPDTA